MPLRINQQMGPAGTVLGCGSAHPTQPPRAPANPEQCPEGWAGESGYPPERGSPAAPRLGGTIPPSPTTITVLSLPSAPG